MMVSASDLVKDHKSSKRFPFFITSRMAAVVS
jgi:hypothetical protein